MVTLRRSHREPFDNQQHLDAWLAELETQAFDVDHKRLKKACELAAQCEQENDSKNRVWPYVASCYQIGREMVEILVDLQVDGSVLPAALLYRSVREQLLPLHKVEQAFGSSTSDLIEGVLRMAAMGGLVNPTRQSVLGQTAGQLDNVRRMLVAMIDDVRVALVKLAERTVIIHAIKEGDAARRIKVAREIFDIYAPLAHRLGVGQLKWELEDLSFRYLHPQDYHRVASLLDEKRVDREHYIRQVADELQQQLGQQGIKAQVKGRVKHIYSIWRKMQEKHLDFAQVYDVRALRVLVSDVSACYATLGIVHSLWHHLPREFDDYIANPKANGYQSLHTAVAGPDNKLLEVQIRTHEMHADAELGVCAHWRYKEGAANDKTKEYEHKIAWLRQVLSWHEELGGEASDLNGGLYLGNGEERVYVFTPKGHVLDLEKGATPIDFAYHVHTEVGHRCRGAKVNGHVVPLNQPLQTGDQVEVLTVKDGGPNRDWLVPSLGYIRSGMARHRVHHWLKRQGSDFHLEQGRQLLDRELSRLALDASPNWMELSQTLGFNNRDDLLKALGRGDLALEKITDLVRSYLLPPQKELIFSGDVVPIDAGSKKNDWLVTDQRGTFLAGCCKPQPGDAIMGCVVSGWEVLVHRADCPDLLARQSADPACIIEVNWGQDSSVAYPVDIYLRAWDKPGLLRDVLSVLANKQVNVSALHTDISPSEETATLLMTIEATSLSNLSHLLALVDQLPDVLEVRRYKK